jgi:hypothetical protein
MTLNQIKFFALAVRRVFIATAFQPGGEDWTLDGMCGDVSYVLVKLFRERGVAAALIYGEFIRYCKGLRVPRGHSWVYLLEPSLFVDLSAQQFHPGYPAVYITHRLRFQGKRNHYLVFEEGDQLLKEQAEDNFLVRAAIRRFHKEFPWSSSSTTAGTGRITASGSSKSLRVSTRSTPLRSRL